MITVLGGLAEFERYLILSRTAEGRQTAKDRGVGFRAQDQAHQASAGRGASANSPTRDTGRNCEELQR
jgi:DNA invertase Pin-like site-specific DNA recombinase